MMMFPSMLLNAAHKAGMKVPPQGTPMIAMGAVGHVDVNVGFDPNEYPHFYVFCQVQLCRPVRWGEHWENAKVVAEIPITKVKQVDLLGLMRKGLQYST